MNEIFEGDEVTLKADREARGTVSQVDEADDTAWVYFDDRPAAWFSMESLILVRRA